MAKLLVLVAVLLFPAAQSLAQPAARAAARPAQDSGGTDDAPSPSLNAKKAWIRSAVDAILAGEGDATAGPVDADRASTSSTR